VIETTRTADERAAQWEARHRAYWALVSQYPGRRYLITDTAVPLAQLVDMITYAQHLLAELQLDGSLIGHVGDGNFHTLLAVPPERMASAHTYSNQLVQRALSLGGTATGEHGIGIVKRPFLESEHGASLAWMRQIKALFDPHDLLNPGKNL
jgi:D-lactate dehydrogenase (cytochrome)